MLNHSQKYDRIIEKLKTANQVKIAVIGDFCLDKYFFLEGDLDEPSVETGLTAFQIMQTKCYPGAAGTIVNNLKSLGAAVECVGIYGEDGDGFDLMQALKLRDAGTGYMICSKEVVTPSYIKPMYCKDGKCSEQNRLDKKNVFGFSKGARNQLKKNLKDAVLWCDAVIVCDQYEEESLALINEDMRECIAALAKVHPQVIFYVDSRARIETFQNAIVKCNVKELMQSMGEKVEKHKEEAFEKSLIIEYGKKLSKKNEKPVMVTLGDQGSLVFEGNDYHEVDAYHSDAKELDICGAGDASNAGFVLGLGLGLSLEAAAVLANGVSSLTIEQIGQTGCASVEQVAQRLKKMATQKESCKINKERG